MRKLLQLSSTLLTLLSLLLAGLVASLAHYPDNTLAITISYLLLFSPRWWTLLLLALPLLLFPLLKKWQWLVWALCALVFVRFQDIQLNLPQQQIGELRVMTLNNGGGANVEQIRRLVSFQQPDIIFMQETKAETVKQIFDSSWYSHCDSLCTVSRTPLEHVGSLSRTSLGGWGNFAVFYHSQIQGKTISLANVHFETPRSTLAAIIHGVVDKQEFQDLHFARNMQASLLASWAKQQDYYIAAGDFNMSVQENIYQRYLSTERNAINQLGSGINYTKYTSWHGIRIDHVLSSAKLSFSAAQVLAPVGGDHRPLLVSMNIP
ncbi:endonuclease/exonuclease/phosphatase family protein [Agarivorans sp.]|uniref:endonuclease/exonuclease/phosphatase family protein n=1 Tax=Agarivorans sp. TaxID=1872412 RepID=UPI003D051290